MKRLPTDLALQGKGTFFIANARILLAIGLGLVILAGGASVVMVLKTAEADRYVATLAQVRQNARTLFSELQDAETGQRGFLLTGDSAYLVPFNQAAKSVPGELAGLGTLTYDNAGQQTRLNRLKPLIDAKFAELRQTIALETRGQHDAAMAIVKTNHGKELMDAIRRDLDGFSRTALTLLIQRQAMATVLRNGLLVLICLCLAIALGIIGLLARATYEAIGLIQSRTTQLEAEIKLRRDTEATLHQVQKLEAVGQLTGGIAHDFNNLLTVILGSLDTLRRRLSDAAPGQSVAELSIKLTKPVELAVQGATSAAQLTHRLLAFSRRQPLAPERLDLNRLVSGMSDLLRRTLGETIAMEMVLAAGMWPAFADANQVENALLNLCVNARDAMPNGGRLTVETATTYLDEAYARQFGDINPGQYVLLNVTDTGTGISPEILPRAFEPFFTTKPDGAGTGLGLAMVHGFVKQSGGHIRIYSELGHGTTVKIYLPRLMQDEKTVAAPAAKAVDTAQVPRAGADETILLVEDNDGVREYGRAALEELGYRVLEAGDADAAMSIFDSTPGIDLLFTDVVLPGASGRELANKILALRPDLPVLYTTGYTRNAIVHNGRLDADVQLLGKPYTQKTLALKIRELLNRKTERKT